MTKKKLTKRNVEEIKKGIENIASPEFLLQARAYSTLATMITGQVTTKDIAEETVKRFPVTDEDEFKVVPAMIESQLLNDGILDWLIEHSLIKVEDNKFVVTGEGIVYGYCYLILLLKQEDVAAEAIVVLFSNLVPQVLKKEFTPTSSFNKEELILLYKEFSKEFFDANSTQH